MELQSIWTRSCELRERPALDKDIKTEAAVIGGGMAGILTAWELESAGVRTVVLEAERIGSGQTGNTTAKITSQHGMFCSEFLERKGKETAEKYVRANEEAVREYKRIVKEKRIDCDLEQTDSYVYSSDEEALEKEVAAAVRLGVNASMERKTEIPVACVGAVRFKDQAQFHPLKFAGALAEELTVYENTPVKKAADNLLRTPAGSVEADKIIFATHYPFINFPGMHFFRMHQERSYVLALEGAGNIRGMYIGDGPDALSFRQFGKYLLLGGMGHRTGEKDGSSYAKLREQAELLYPGSREIACWSAQDCITADRIPFIGQYSPEKPSWYVASGFQKWGMTSSMVSALLLKDLVCERENPYTEVFTPSRFSAEEIPQIAKDSRRAVKGLAKRFFHLPGDTINMIEPGHAAVVETPEGRAGVYKSEDNQIYQVDVVCPHLGCRLAWNQDERSWDCPCHGSRFDYKGNLLDGPAQEGICLGGEVREGDK